MNSEAASHKAAHRARPRWWAKGRSSGWATRVVRGSIATRLVIFAIVLVTLTASVIGSLAYVRARRALEKEARVRLTLSAGSIAEHFRRELEDRVADITNWSHLEVMRAVLFEDVDKQLAEFLRQIVQGRPLYRAIQCFDAAGRQVAAAGETGVSVIESSPPGPRMVIVSTDGGAERGLRVDAPLRNPDHPDVSIGTLVVVIDPRRVLDTENPIVRTAGALVHLTLRTRSGEILMQTVNARTPGHVAVGRRAGAAMLTGAAAVGRLANVDGPDLQVVVAESTGAALGAITTLPATLVRIATFALLVSAAFGTFVAWRITRPIRRLTDTVRQISERGEVEADAESPPRSGEVGVLAAAFRTMMENLTAAQAEALVQSRLAFLGEIAANVAHEVRTPLSVLKTSAQLLTRPEAEIGAAERLRLAATIVAEVDRLNRVVTDLVDLARPKPGRYRIVALASIVARSV